MLTSIVYSYAVLFFMTRIVHVQLHSRCEQPDPDFATGVNLLYYKCNNENTTIAYPITAPEDMLSELEDKRTIFYVFGYMQYPGAPNLQVMIKALCYKRTDNVVLLDWSIHSKDLYPTVCENAFKVGSLFAQGIQLLVKNDLDISKIYIVGHSLGAHIAGFAGKCNNFTIPRITALDPANPSLYPPGCGSYLTRTDASWIDVIHTDAGVYGACGYDAGVYGPCEYDAGVYDPCKYDAGVCGTRTKMGTAEFYANTGSRPQTGCPMFGKPPNPIGITATDICSHQRSVELYADSKSSPETSPPAYKCSSYCKFNRSECKENEMIDIGYQAPNKTGTYYFKT